MKINVTPQTTTFPVPLTKLKGRLHDQVGLNWETEFGKIHLSSELADWIALNAHTSMYNSDRSYVYNKALWEAFKDINSLESLNEYIEEQKDESFFTLIRQWADERGLYKKGDSKTQYIKLQEEAGELAKALLKDDQDEVVDAKAEIQDAIGDMIVVLTNLAYMENLNVEECIAGAYAVISKRTGKMINGTFVKDEKEKDI